MSELGALLKRAREERGLSLEALQEKTKIQKRYLAYMEAGEWHKLPGSFYARAFVRSVAEALDLDPARLLEQYAHELPEAEGVPQAVPLRRGETFPRPNYFGPWVARLLLVVFLLLVAMIVYWFLTQNSAGRSDRASLPEPSVENRLSPSKSVPPVGTGSTTPASPSGTVSGGGLSGAPSGESTPGDNAASPTEPRPVLEFKGEVGKTGTYVLRNATRFDLTFVAARGRVWIEVRTKAKDGPRVLQKTIESGEKTVLTADEIGDADKLYVHFGATRNADVVIGEETLSLADKPDSYWLEITRIPPTRGAGPTSRS